MRHRRTVFGLTVAALALTLTAATEGTRPG